MILCINMFVCFKNLFKALYSDALERRVSFSKTEGNTCFDQP